MLIQSAGQPQEMSVCVLTNDVSISLSNAIQFFFFPLSSLDRPVSFLNTATHVFIFGSERVEGRLESFIILGDERHTREIMSCDSA